MRQTNIPNLTQIETPTSLTSTTKEAIKNAIIKGELKQGAIYSELALASQWGISKTPIHNALVELSGKGFVTILPRKGFKVGALTTKDLGSLFQFRRALEITVVDHVTGSLQPQEIQLFEKLVTDFENSATIEDFMGNDRAFHERLTQLTDNQFFIDALKNVWDHMAWLGAGNLVRQSSGPELGKNQKQVFSSQREHRKIWEAIKKGDKIRAKQSMEKHLLRVEQQYLKILETEQEISPNKYRL